MSNDTDHETRCRGVIRGVQFGWNEYNGAKSPQIVCRFEILDGDDKGKLDTWFASLSEDLNSKGKPFCDFTIESLRACGWTGDDLSELSALVVAGKLTNEVSLVRKHKLKDGKWNSMVKYVNRLGVSKIDLKDKAMADADVLAFAKRMKTKVGGVSSQRSTNSDRNDDDRDPPPLDPDSDLPW